MTLSRGLTNAAFVEYLEADERMAPLAVCLVDDTVLGDTLIDAIMQFKSGNPEALRPYFPKAQIGLLGSLAQKLHLFICTEEELKKLEKKDSKVKRDEAKSARLLAAIVCKWSKRPGISPFATKEATSREVCVTEVAFAKRGATHKT